MKRSKNGISTSGGVIQHCCSTRDFLLVTQEHWSRPHKDFVEYSWPLNNMGVRGASTLQIDILHVPFDSQKMSVMPPYPQSIGSTIYANTKIYRSTDTPVPYIIWRRVMHTVAPLHPLIQRTNCIFIEKKSVYNWTCAVNTCVVQRSIVLWNIQIFPFLGISS